MYIICFGKETLEPITIPGNLCFSAFCGVGDASFFQRPHTDTPLQMFQLSLLRRNVGHLALVAVIHGENISIGVFSP